MKNILRLFSMIAVFVLAFSFAQAQRAILMPLVAGDTIVNTGTVTKLLPALTAGYSGVSIQANLAKISGTGAGTAQLQISLDGTNFVNSGSAFTITNVAAQSASFTISSPVPVYAQILFTGSGTESVQVRIYYVARKYGTTLSTNQ